jgi:acyl-CoA thioester hydrolase
LSAVGGDGAVAGFETYRGVAYPWQCDGMGHLNTQFYSALFDGATLHALSAIAPGAMLKEAGLGWADVRQSIEYRHEVASGTLLLMRTQFLALGVTSVSYRHALHGFESGILHATSEQKTVLFDLTRRKATPLTGPMLSNAAKLGVRRP